MTQSFNYHIFIAPMLLLITLMACNLSSTAGTELQLTEVIITATSKPSQASEFIAPGVTDDNSVTNLPPNQLIVSDNDTQLDDLYYTGNPLPAPSDICYVFTAGDFNVNIRAAQSVTATILGQLRANHYIRVRNIVNDWFSIDAPNTPVDGAYISSGPVQLVSTCRCTNISCCIYAGPLVCELTGHANTITKIYTEPANWSQVVGELTAGQPYRTVAQSTSGWYQLEIGGWVPSNYLQVSSGENCRHLPTIAYDGPILGCELVNTTSEIVVITNAPDGDYFGRFGVNLQLGIIKREGNWYQVYVPAFSNAGWVNGSNMTLAGDCGDFE